MQSSFLTDERPDGLRRITAIQNTSMPIIKTETGLKVMKDRSVALAPRQRAAFILFDGRRTLDQVLTATAPGGVSRDDIQTLFELGLIIDAAPAGEVAAAQVRPHAIEVRKQRTPQERYADAYPIATRLTASMGLRGFRLNLAVEAATGYEQLVEVAPKIRDAVGAERYGPLDDALNDR